MNTLVLLFGPGESVSSFSCRKTSTWSTASVSTILYAQFNAALQQPKPPRGISALKQQKWVTCKSMDEVAKINFSPKEVELVINKDWILTKQVITSKVCSLFANLAAAMQHHVLENGFDLPGFIRNANPKISKGENYLGLPYVVLDYPRLFSREDTLAIRTFFWWGNHFSITLQASGKSLLPLHPTIRNNFVDLQSNGYYICIADTAWQHHFEPDNYVSLSKIDEAAFASLLNRNFVKMAVRLGVEDWEKAPQFIEAQFIKLVSILRVSYPAGETSLSPGTPTTDFGL